MKRRRTKGLTLMEIVIVLVIISILALFAMPNIPRMRDSSQTRSCIGNLWLVRMAKEQWALDESIATTTEVEWSDIVPDYLESRPSCPATGTSSNYTLNVTGENPTCDQGGHAIGAN